MLSLSLLGAQAVFAAPLSGLHVPVAAKMGKVKMVSFKLQNSTSMPITFKAGDQQMTVQAGATSMVKVPVGTQLVAVSDTPMHAAGTVLATVDSDLGGNMLTIN